MAIAAVDLFIFKKLKDAGVFPARPSVLELGESEWYGDATTEALSDEIDAQVADPARRETLHQKLVDTLCGDSPSRGWDLAKIFYQVFLDYEKITAIDLHGTPAALRIDLNQPVELGEQFDFVINNGTGEHVFNIGQFFRSVHEFTRPGGLMMHVMPFRGWLEHGFYSFNPTFFWDLAAANDYAVLILAYTELQPPKVIQLKRREKIVELARSGALGANANLCAVMRRNPVDSEFRIPMQGVYGDGISEEMVKAWHDLR